MRCDLYDPTSVLEHPSGFEVLVGFLIFLGTIISVIPQFIRLIKRKSSRGLSGFSFFLGHLNQFNVCLNGIILHLTHFKACQIAGFSKCAGSFLGILNYVGLFICFLPLTPMILYYFDGEDMKDYYRTRYLFVSFSTYAISISFTVFALVLLFDRCFSLVIAIANFAGYTTVFINIWQWFPQILETFRIKSSGSFSTVMTCIQAPGAVISLVYFIIIGEDFTTWISYFTSAVQQVTLLYLLIYYDIKNSRKVKTAEPLLLNSEVEAI
ncbi:hypothetical protein RCL1_007533 [Eukaryota sp. TZLM3-RCL]